MCKGENNKYPQFGYGYEKCARCYWYDDCPLKDMDKEEINEMKERGFVNEDEFADYSHVKKYYKQYCEYYTPFDDDEIAIIGYERDLREREKYYKEIIDEQNN